MIRGEAIKERDLIIRPEVNYRELSALNVSMIKLFDDHPVHFFEQFKLGKKKKDKKSTALIIGDLVDFYLIDCKRDEDEFNNRFDEKFALFQNVKGSGQVYVLADTLFEITQSYLNDDNSVSVSFDTLFTEAFSKMKALKKYNGRTEDWALKDFYENGYEYYQLMVDNLGKTVIDVSLLDKAKSIVKMLTEDQFTRDIFDETSEVEMFPKFPIEWLYKANDGEEIECKSELDMLKINHKTKKIYLMDLKTTYDNEEFEANYIKQKYYLQAAFYYMAVEYWKKQEGLSEYEIVPMEFIVADTSSNNRRPIRYKTSLHDVNMSLKGFSLNGDRHRGVIELMEEIHWAEITGNWNVSKNVVDNKGVLQLKMNYD